MTAKIHSYTHWSWAAWAYVQGGEKMTKDRVGLGWQCKNKINVSEH